MSITYRNATPADRPALEQHLLASGLPIEDLPAEVGTFFLAFDGPTLVGSAGLEILGPVGLLRSVAVADAYRGRGLADALVAMAESESRQRGLAATWLITTTADRYFEKHGYRRVERARVAPEVQATAQFSTLCASTAVVMQKEVFERAVTI